MTETPKRLLVFGFDAAEAAQIRRMRSYLECGFSVLGATMRRNNMNDDFTPFWDNIHLGNTRNAAMAQRVKSIFTAIWTMWGQRKRIQDTDVIVARNLDMLAIATATRAMIRTKPPLIYECLDIHDLMVDQGLKGRIVRGLERFLLKRTAAIIVSSPAFTEQYFKPVQGWNGPVALIENKLWRGPDGALRPTADSVIHRKDDDPIILGWVGTLRCTDSLALLAGVAARLGPKVVIRMHGIVHHHALPNFEDTLSKHPIITYAGPYAYPDGLAEVYQNCDLVWAQDLWQWGTNSTWLLPNRIYEAGYFGCPCVAVAGTQTGKRVADGLGWTIDAPDIAKLTTLIESLDHAAIVQARLSLLNMPDGTFLQTCDDIRDALHLPFSAS